MTQAAFPTMMCKGVTVREPCRVVVNAESINTDKSNRIAKAAVGAARTFAVMRRRGRPDLEIFRAILDQTKDSPTIQQVRMLPNEQIERSITFVRAMVVTDVSEIMEDRIQITIALKENDFPEKDKFEKAVRTIFIKIKNADLMKKSADSMPIPQLFYEDEASQMEGEEAEPIFRFGHYNTKGNPGVSPEILKIADEKQHQDTIIDNDTATSEPMRAGIAVQGVFHTLPSDDDDL